MTTAAAPPRKPRRFLGWQVAALATITAALSGPGQTIGVSVFVDPMIETLDLTRSELSTAYLIGTLLGAVALVPVGRWIDLSLIHISEPTRPTRASRMPSSA